MSLDSDKKQNINDFDSMLSPFLNKKDEKTVEVKANPAKTSVSPLDAVINSLNKNTEAAKKENETKKETETKKEIEPIKTESSVLENKAATEQPKADTSVKQTPVKRSVCHSFMTTE